MKRINNFRINQQCKSIAAYRTLVLCLIMTLVSGCKKFIEVGPPQTELARERVFSDDVSATAAMEGIYYDFASAQHYTGGFLADLTYVLGETADEFNIDAGGTASEELVENKISINNDRIEFIWSKAYSTNYNVNAILEGLSASSGVSVAMKKQLEGEAKFIRAFNYFHLVNLFGDVPLITATDYTINAVATRTASAQVYELIIKDLKDAQNLLTSDYSYSQGQRVRANKWAATALLARIYLYQKDWAKAEAEATSVLNNAGLYSLVGDLNNVYLKNSTEAIWQLVTVEIGINTYHGLLAAFYNAVAGATMTITDDMLNAFEVNDNRRVSWVGSSTMGSTYFYANKYKVAFSDVKIEYTMLLRLAEQYLIRAEARAQQGNIAGAQTDINVIRNRAGLPNIIANSQVTLLSAIEQERRVEFFAEYGHRWLDLKRWNRATAVLGPIKPDWQPTDVLYPIPQKERDRNVNLTQNAGY